MKGKVKKDMARKIIVEGENITEQDLIKYENEYIKKEPDVIEKLLPEIEIMWGKIDKSKLVEQLGEPHIDLDTCEISYPNNSFDNEHIILIEYSGEMSKFFNVSIEG